MRFLVFCYDEYYPSGGVNDFVGGFATFDEAMAAWKDCRGTCGHIATFSGDTFSVLRSFYCDGMWEHNGSRHGEQGDYIGQVAR